MFQAAKHFIISVNQASMLNKRGNIDPKTDYKNIRFIEKLVEDEKSTLA